MVSGRMIGTAREHNGIYVFDEGSSSNKLVQITFCLKTTSAINDPDIYSWHFRLGHSSFH